MVGPHITVVADFATLIARPGFTKARRARAAKVTRGVIFRAMNPDAYDVGGGTLRNTTAWNIAQAYAERAELDRAHAFARRVVVPGAWQHARRARSCRRGARWWVRDGSRHARAGVTAIEVAFQVSKRLLARVYRMYREMSRRVCVGWNGLGRRAQLRCLHRLHKGKGSLLSEWRMLDNDRRTVELSRRRRRAAQHG